MLLEVIDKVTQKEMEMQDREGRWFSLRLHPYRTSDNRIDGVILAIVDIDDLKRTQEQLLKYVAAIVDTVRAPLLVLHSDLRVNTANDAFYRTFQVSKTETENHLIYELGDNQWDIPELRQLLSGISSGKSVLKDFEITKNFPAIGRRMMLLNARRLEQRGGMPMILLSIEDITEWRQIEEINRWLAAIVESSQDVIIGEDLNGIIASCNHGAKRLFGYKREELIGKPVTILIPPERQNEESEIPGRIRRGEHIENHETVRRRKDGSLIDISLTISPVKDIHGKIIGVSTIARDITERKHAEKQLAESLEREKTARQTAETANRAKDAFLASLSHELRTPLSPVLLIASDAALDRELPPGIRANFEIIRKNVELESQLIDDLLDMTRIASGKMSLKMSDANAHTILQDSIAYVQADLEEKQIRLSLKLMANEYTVRGDSIRLQQVFWNILKNAVKFTPRRGEIAVETSASEEGGHLVVKIADSGIGMTPQELSRIFLVFSQGDHATDGIHRFGGLGLGLAISQKIIELHSGSIHAESAGRDQGTVFTIQLPLAEKKA
jgi:two-component system, chemotaxis family, CheB/CheR fusion protein